MVNEDGIIENFMGVKVGDLNRSVEAHANMIRPRSEYSTSLSSLDQYVTAGEKVDITFNIHQFAGLVNGAQWELKMNAAKLLQVKPIAEGMTEEMYVSDEASARFSWTATEPVFSSELMTLTIEAEKSGWLSEMITLNNSFLEGEVYDEYDETYSLNLQWMNAVEVADAQEVQLHQNRPNPWTDETIIPFELPEAGEVTLSITNAIGEEVMSHVRHFSSGKQQYKIRNESWPAGLYYYTLRFGDIQLTKTMLILNKR